MSRSTTIRRTTARIIGITGTPGVGKRSVAPLVARRLGLRCFSLNDLARRYGLSGSTEKDSEVDARAFRRALGRKLSGKLILYGHLLPFVVPRPLTWRVAVLRCDPAVLKGRLERRGYPHPKIIDNVEAELIGLLSTETFRAFGTDRVFELDTTCSTPSKTADQVEFKTRSEVLDSERYDWTTSYDSAGKLRSLLSLDKE